MSDRLTPQRRAEFEKWLNLNRRVRASGGRPLYRACWQAAQIAERKRLLAPSPCGVTGHKMADWSAPHNVEGGYCNDCRAEFGPECRDGSCRACGSESALRQTIAALQEAIKELEAQVYLFRNALTGMTGEHFEDCDCVGCGALNKEALDEQVHTILNCEDALSAGEPKEPQLAAERGGDAK